jgi:hypothetical protein
LAEGIKTIKPVIKNILMLSLESTRKDMFPLKKGSHVYKTILSSYSSPNASKELDEKLKNLTPVATFLSGESNNFDMDEEPVEEGSWRESFKPTMGGINVQGAVTQAAFTLKSLLSSHCGVEVGELKRIALWVIMSRFRSMSVVSWIIIRSKVVLVLVPFTRRVIWGSVVTRRRWRRMMSMMMRAMSIVLPAAVFRSRHPVQTRGLLEIFRESIPRKLHGLDWSSQAEFGVDGLE